MIRKDDPTDVEKAGRKAVPKSVPSWLEEVAGVARFVDQRARLKDAQGANWLASMQNYYRARLAVLLTDVPPGMTKTAAQAIVNDLRRKIP